MKTPLILSSVLAGLMAGQSALGLLFPAAYRDSAWIRAAWYGNDWVTLAVAVPLLSGALVLAHRGSVRGQLLWLGLLGYALYNYAFYLFGAALNVFFPLYVGSLVLSGVALIFAVSRLSAETLAQRFDPSTHVRLVGAYLAFVALGLTVLWMVMWTAYIFRGVPTPAEPEAFKLVAALDLALMVPALASAGILLWRRRPWGYTIAAIASVQAALYLLVLSVNSAVGIDRGLEEAPGELPVWGPLATTTAAAVYLLLKDVRPEGEEIP